jgi:cell division septal protein FtsQ
MVGTRRRSNADSSAQEKRSSLRKQPQVLSRKPLRPAKQRDDRLDDRSMPPVMVRGVDTTDLPWGNSKRSKTKPRRRYDVSLNMPGVEMRLPAIPQIAFGWRLVSFVLVAALITLLYHLWNSPNYRVEAAQISGLQRLSMADVNAVLDVNDEPIFTVNPVALEEKLALAFPEFSSVAVDIVFPSEVLVEVEERQPLIAWHQDGRTELVDANGVSFPVREQNPVLPALMVEAHGAPDVIAAADDETVTQQFMPVEMVSAIVSMSGQAPKGTPLMYDPQRGLGWRDSQGWEVYFGDTNNMDVKLKVYRAIADKLNRDGVQPALVSVEHIHLPYYRLER